MIELRNRQYMTVLDCVAGEDLEQGHVIRLIHVAGRDLPLSAVKATASAHIQEVTGPLVAHWINDRSTAVAFSGGEDGLSFPVAAATDEDANHHIPSGTRMLAVGGKGVAEIRFFKSSLDAEFATTLPDPGTVVDFDTQTSKLCSTGNGNASGVTGGVGYVVDNDGVSVAVILG